jgi:hypothetical protein
VGLFTKNELFGVWNETNLAEYKVPYLTFSAEVEENYRNLRQKSRSQNPDFKPDPLAS